MELAARDNGTEAPHEDRSAPKACCDRPQPETPPDGETICKNCGAVLDEPAANQALEFTPDIWREHRRLKRELQKVESGIATFQSFTCKAPGCHAPVFKGRRGPPRERCDTHARLRNREKVRAWRLSNPEAWLEIRKGYEINKNPERRREIEQKYEAEKKRVVGSIRRQPDTPVIRAV